MDIVKALVELGSSALQLAAAALGTGLAWRAVRNRRRGDDGN